MITNSKQTRKQSINKEIEHIRKNKMGMSKLKNTKTKKEKRNLTG